MHGDRQVDLMLAAEHGELLEFYREISGAKGGERPAAANIRIKNAIIMRRGTVRRSSRCTFQKR